ncbi:SDR family oxidoreductase [Hyphomicrobium methylovorum]|uniref:SDR family oxidoreductase n=1 Tax=Hyphomicrobium methylovorum TaxID=84 RepID=UPI0015E7C992|nr:SDR family oxidoreductase [Hyphomicrobium methylovorum]MBA2127036.1 SDR family oxidoreductase [Hyphomicrobium methylovorum]
MYMDRISARPEDSLSGEFADTRVLVTGLTATAGVDVARSFAELNAKLVVQTTEPSQDLIELVAFLTQSAGDIRLHTLDLSGANAAARFAQTSAQVFGGLDVAINMATVSEAELDAIELDHDLDALVSAKLDSLAQLTRVLANRMSLVMTDGLILNVLKMPTPRHKRDAAVAGYLRTALAAMTAAEARDWADKGIRVNAVGPRVIDAGDANTGAVLTNETDVAALALHLASRKGRSLSGHVFDAAGMEC